MILPHSYGTSSSLARSLASSKPVPGPKTAKTVASEVPAKAQPPQRRSKNPKTKKKEKKNTHRTIRSRSDLDSISISIRFDLDPVGVPSFRGVPVGSVQRQTGKASEMVPGERPETTISCSLDACPRGAKRGKRSRHRRTWRRHRAATPSKQTNHARSRGR